MGAVWEKRGAGRARDEQYERGPLRFIPPLSDLNASASIIAGFLFRE